MPCNIHHGFVHSKHKGATLKSKKAIGPEALVIMISLLATAVIFLIILYPQWRGAAEGGAEGSAECSSELLLRSLVKKVSFGYGDVPVNCEVKKVKVDETAINRLMPLAEQSTKLYLQQNSPLMMEYQNDALGQRKWALSKIVADELVSCHKKGWEGKLDLEQTGLLDFYPPSGALCLYCSRIEYTEDVKNNNIQMELYPWLENNIISGRTYYDYLSSALFDVDFWQSVKIYGPKAALSAFLRIPNIDDTLIKSMSTRVFVSSPYIDTNQPTAVMLVIFKDGGAFATAQPLKELVTERPGTGKICGKIIGEV